MWASRVRRVSGGAGVKRTTCRVAAHALSWTPFARSEGKRTAEIGRGRRLVHHDDTTKAHKLFNPRLQRRELPLEPLHRAQHPVNLVPARVHEARVVDERPVDRLERPGWIRRQRRLRRAVPRDGERESKMSSFLRITASCATETCGSLSASSTPPLGLTLIPFSM